SPLLLEGLKRLEYRGYDSAGLAVISNDQKLQRIRIKGKVNQLEAQYKLAPLRGFTGISHTRWATHGKPSINNAHPHICKEQLALVHNGIIENHNKLREQQITSGFKLKSDTDTEVIVNALFELLDSKTDLLAAMFKVIKKLEGAYALGVINTAEPNRLIAARKGSPLVIGVGIDEYFVASDVFALLPATQKFIYLEEGDVADISADKLTIYNKNRKVVEREIHISDSTVDVSDKEGYRHYMLKEIFFQADAISQTLEDRINNNKVIGKEFGESAEAIFSKTKSIKIVACGTSYHAGLIAAYWMEKIANIHCQVEIASEFRYRRSVIRDDTLFVSISQSGETADTLAALRSAKDADYLSTLAICNVDESSLTRESDLVFLTHAGIEIGVASTKAFTTQLAALFLFVITIAKHNGLTDKDEEKLVKQLKSLPSRVNQVLEHKDTIELIAKDFADKHHALFLGRGSFLPVAMEGALKLKEISYIHAEAYAAGELKHGPLALVDEDMPVVAVAPNNTLLEKLKSNLEEVKARGGKLYIFADEISEVESSNGMFVLNINNVYDYMAPILHTIPLQLLAYYVAVIKGADIDQPRNLAKSVTVE
ncbi:MAG TPA: glutamine--fructose-6-phosphate transaminase (isomerizing), partial [Gammaproteobacteria bacterium]|nr:glutamine--fructose-6-phosphate transaminase (isomerizing) [Gammaproteobacteria bacterium]